MVVTTILPTTTTAATTTLPATTATTVQEMLKIRSHRRLVYGARVSVFLASSEASRQCFPNSRGTRSSNSRTYLLPEMSHGIFAHLRQYVSIFVPVPFARQYEMKRKSTVAVWLLAIRTHPLLVLTKIHQTEQRAFSEQRSSLALFA